MSRVLEYPAKCEKCNRVMPSGTSADFFKDGGTYRYTHAIDCEEAHAAALPVKLRKRFEFRTCPDPICYAGHPGWAFRDGCVPPRCHICNKPWLDESLRAAA